MRDRRKIAVIIGLVFHTKRKARRRRENLALDPSSVFLFELDGKIMTIVLAGAGPASVRF
jgi:hypothetical protein